MESIYNKCFSDLEMKVDDIGYYKLREKIATYIEEAKKGIFY